MADVKKDRKKIIKVLSLIIFIILIIALATYAWFTRSDSVFGFHRLNGDIFDGYSSRATLVKIS